MKKHQSEKNNHGIASVSSLNSNVKKTANCHNDDDKNRYFSGLKNHHFTLFGSEDNYIAIIQNKSLLIIKYNDIGALDKNSARILVEVKTKKTLTHVIPAGLRRPLELIVADQSGAIHSYDFSLNQSRRSLLEISK